ncbi:hypothetical protein A2U01_0112331, partial [Trifolium medium]|nr:hypothetical protein [Trifolium medium]
MCVTAVARRLQQ